MGMRSTVVLTTSPAGGGKSYLRCARFLVDEWLSDYTGKHISNFPVGLVPATHIIPPAYEGETFADRIAEAVSKRTGQDRDELRRRIEIIPEEILTLWREGKSGPWEYFADSDLTGCHIAIDEIHVYCGSKASKTIKGLWQKWLGEIRHRGATVELISQHKNKIARELRDEAGAAIAIVNQEDERDPFFGVLLGDWYELRARFITGEYKATVLEIEKRDFDGTWRVNRQRKVVRDPYYFQFYDSFNAPHSGQGSGASQGAALREFQKRSHLGLLWWFTRRNGLRFVSRSFIIVLLMWFAVGGGGGVVVGMAQKYVGAMVNKPKQQNQATAPRPNPRTSSPTPPALSSNKPKSYRKGESEEERLVPAAELDAANEKLQVMQKEKAVLEAQMQRAFAVALLTEDSVTFHGGFTYAVGDTIDYGPYEGRTIEKIDWSRRSVALSDGQWLRMSRAGDMSAQPDRGVQVVETAEVAPVDAPPKTVRPHLR